MPVVEKGLFAEVFPSTLLDLAHDESVDGVDTATPSRPFDTSPEALNIGTRRCVRSIGRWAAQPVVQLSLCVPSASLNSEARRPSRPSRVKGAEDLARTELWRERNCNRIDHSLLTLYEDPCRRIGRSSG
jgi:hypothetical protein